MKKHRAKKAFAREEGVHFHYKPSGSKKPTAEQWARHFAKIHPAVNLEMRSDGRIVCGKSRPPFRKSEMGGLDGPGGEPSPDTETAHHLAAGAGDAPLPAPGEGAGPVGGT